MPSCPACRANYPEGTARCTTDGEQLLDDAAFSNVDTDLPPGTVVGEYRILAKIGEGGFGAVYSAVHPLIGKRAAVKALHRQHSTNPQIVGRFIAEAKAVNQIRHRNIIDIFSFGTLPDGRHYFLMELLEGQTLEAYFRGKGRLTLRDALPILRGVAEALDAAHAKGIAHRDLKPENIFLVAGDGGELTPKLLDFGVAKLSAADERGVKTRTGAPIGTPYYMSPEQSRGVNVDYRTDIYALGVMCFQILTGSVPFDGVSMMDIMMKHSMSPPPRMSDVVPGMAGELDGPIRHMLAKDPLDRPRSASIAVDELETAGRGLPDQPYPPAHVTIAARESQLPETPYQATSASLPAPPTAFPHSGAVATPLPAGAPPPLTAAVTAPDAPLATVPPVRPTSQRWTYAAAVVTSVALVLVVLVVQLAAPKNPLALPLASMPTASPRPVDPTPAPTPSQAPSPVTSSVPLSVIPSAPDPVEFFVDSTPSGAHVSTGGKPLGLAPGPFTLPAESATLDVSAGGYLPGTITVTPAPGKRFKITLKGAGRAAPPRRALNPELENAFPTH